MTKQKKIILIIVSCVLLAAIGVGITLGIMHHKQKRKDEENARLIREYYEQKIETYKQENQENPNVDLVFLGDSLTDGCDLSLYYSEYTCLNRGIGGDTTYGLKDRLEVSAYQTKPKAIVLLIGGNDILGGKSLESIYENYADIIAGLKKQLPDTKIVWCSQTVLGKEWAKHNATIRSCNQKILSMAAANDCAFVDLYSPLCDPDTGEIKEAYTIEGVHLTDEGYKVVSSKIKAALEKVLG